MTGQLLSNIQAHLGYTPSILSRTPQTADGGKAYFPCLYNIPLFEAMTGKFFKKYMLIKKNFLEAYEKFEMNVYYISIVSFFC